MPRSWNKTEDDLLISIVHSVGMQWNEVTKRYNRQSRSCRTRDSIRNRWHRILRELRELDFLCYENFEELDAKIEDEMPLNEKDIINILFQYGTMDQ